MLPLLLMPKVLSPEGRIDFVLVDECLRHPDLRSFVMEIDLAVQRPDHFAVAVDIPLTIWAHDRSSRPSRCPRIATGVCSPVAAWNLDVHSHAAVLHQWLQSCQPARPKLPRKRHLQESTWQLIQLKAHHWKRCRHIRATLREIFHRWRHGDCHADDGFEFFLHGLLAVISILLGTSCAIPGFVLELLMQFAMMTLPILKRLPIGTMTKHCLLCGSL